MFKDLEHIIEIDLICHETLSNSDCEFNPKENLEVKSNQKITFKKFKNKKFKPKRKLKRKLKKELKNGENK